MLKAYKYRLYPNKQQIEQMQKTFGCCRFVYNQTLSHRKEMHETQKESMNKTSCNNYCNQVLKKEYEWLKEVDKFALTNTIYNMDAAYQKFFKEHAVIRSLRVNTIIISHIQQILQMETSKYLLRITKLNYQNSNGLKQKYIVSL